MKDILYADLHCDTLTACLESGQNLLEFDGQVNLKKLKMSGCAAQCFAIFTDGDGSDKKFVAALNYFKRSLKIYGKLIRPARNAEEVRAAVKEGKIAAILTVENLSFMQDKLNIPWLKKQGVCMASLVWNNKNSLAYPNLKTLGGAPCPYIREKRALTDRGREAVYSLNKNKIIIDISHLSDGGVDEVIRLSKKPVVASHSAAASIVNVSRNLTDDQIKAIADGGGVVGVNFCPSFVGNQNIAGAVQNILHVFDVGGEDAACLGSDFDGMSRKGQMKDCTLVPAIFKRLAAQGLTPRLIEKIAIKNFLQVLEEF
jgi:membrane dipeptidase